MTTSVSYPARATRPIDEVVGAERLRSRTHEDLVNALTWLAWSQPGIFTRVMDYLDWGNGELYGGNPED